VLIEVSFSRMYDFVKEGSRITTVEWNWSI